MTGTPGQTQHVPRRRSTLRRWVAPIACLLIGMVLSIVSGWVCILMTDDKMVHVTTGSQWSVPVAPEWGTSAVSQETSFGLGWTRLRQSASKRGWIPWAKPGEEYPGEQGEIGRLEVSRIEAGFPLVSAWAYVEVEAAPPPSWLSTKRTATNGLKIPPAVARRFLQNMKSPSHFPVIPLFPGFALNTLIYAALTWCILFAPGYLRRRRRLARHQCPACAYPIGTTTACTECGEPVTPRVPRAAKS